MDFKKICKNIDKNKSMNIHNYYQKILALLFMEGCDPFNRNLLSIDAEKKVGDGIVDLFLQWKYKDYNFSEIIEVQLKPKKKVLENKIKLYEDKTNLFSVCVPSNQLNAARSVLAKMKGNISKINIVYLIDSEAVSKNKRKLVKDRNMVVGLHSPHYITKKEDLDLIKNNLDLNRYFLFDALLPFYLK